MDITLIPEPIDITTLLLNKVDKVRFVAKTSDKGQTTNSLIHSNESTSVDLISENIGNNFKLDGYGLFPGLFFSSLFASLST
jgi:hypothetical protein